MYPLSINNYNYQDFWPGKIGIMINGEPLQGQEPSMHLAANESIR